MEEKLLKDLDHLRVIMSDGGVQTIAPCLGGIAHFETRDIGPKEIWPEGPDWMYRGKPESCKDIYKKRRVDTINGYQFIVFECIKRCVMSNAPLRDGEPYLNQNSFEHLLECFAHEYLKAIL